MQNVCVCQKYYSGSNCQWITCLNGGVNVTSTDCSCDHKRYYGTHCQTTKCDNGGVDNGQGSCDCVKGWYTGKYCETYGSPWLIVFGVAGSLLVLLLLCCIVYRFGCKTCKKRSRPNRDVTARSHASRTGGHERSATHGSRHGSTREETQPTMAVDPRDSKPPEYRAETPPPTYELALSWSRENLDKIDNEDENISLRSLATVRTNSATGS